MDICSFYFCCIFSHSSFLTFLFYKLDGWFSKMIEFSWILQLDRTYSTSVIEVSVEARAVQRNRPWPLRKTIPSDEKSFSRQTQRSNIKNNTALWLKALLLHKETEWHWKPIHRNGLDGSHKTRNNPTISAPTQLQRRRMDLHRNNNSQRSHKTHRKRIPIRHNNRRNTTIQKTQITLFFL